MTLSAAEEILGRLAPLGMRLGLTPFRRLLAGLGEPHREVPAVLVAGTNGKGSTAALLAAIGCAAGHRVGLYTSPHLEDPRERIRIDGIALPTLELDRLLTAVVEAADDELPTPFEALTAAAFLAFAEGGVDLAVLEVGLGGRLDATNACDPLLSVVTEIALDHQRELGADLGSIAGEKAGIFRRGRPALVWGEKEEPLAAFTRAAAASGAELQVVSQKARLLAVESGGLAGQRVRLHTQGGDHRLELPLAGRHQLANLALAVSAAEELSHHGWPRFDREAIAAGVAGCRWPGRLEPVAIPGERSVLLDGAHNPHAAERLASFLEQLAMPYDLVFGALADKDVAGIAGALAPRARRIFLAPPASERAMPVAELGALPGLRSATPAPALPDALDLALAAADAAPLLVISGSLYLVGEARSELRRRFGVPPRAAEVSTWQSPEG